MSIGTSVEISIYSHNASDENNDITANNNDNENPRKPTKYNKDNDVTHINEPVLIIVRASTMTTMNNDNKPTTKFIMAIANNNTEAA